MGPKPPSPGSGNCFLITVTDKYSRFTFAFPRRSITLTTVISCPRHLFSVFGYPSFIHTDRGKQFCSNKFQQFCQKNGIAQSQTAPYHPVGNGQCERMNETIGKAVCCLSESRKIPPVTGKVCYAKHYQLFVHCCARQLMKPLIIDCSSSSGGKDLAITCWRSRSQCCVT